MLLAKGQLGLGKYDLLRCRELHEVAVYLAEFSSWFRSNDDHCE